VVIYPGGGHSQSKDYRMCVPMAKNRPHNVDLIRAIANKTKELSSLMRTGLSDNSSRRDETAGSRYFVVSGFAH
jgi:hypothetical protein